MARLRNSYLTDQCMPLHASLLQLDAAQSCPCCYSTLTWQCVHAGAINLASQEVLDPLQAGAAPHDLRLPR